jgi:hypothetical protein
LFSFPRPRLQQLAPGPFLACLWGMSSIPRPTAFSLGQLSRSPVMSGFWNMLTAQPQLVSKTWLPGAPALLLCRFRPRPVQASITVFLVATTQPLYMLGTLPCHLLGCLLPLLPAMSLVRLLTPLAVLDRFTLALLDFALDPVLVALDLPREGLALAHCPNCNCFFSTNLQFHAWSHLDLPRLPLASLDLVHCRSLILTAAAGLSWTICRISPERARLLQWWTLVSKRVTLFFETPLPRILVAFTGWSAATA